MTYESVGAFRQALEQRLLNQARQTGTDLNRLRRRVVFERILLRLTTSQPGMWVVKGGMAVELRIGDSARMTKDLDLNLRADTHREPNPSEPQRYGTNSTAAPPHHQSGTSCVEVGGLSPVGFPWGACSVSPCVSFASGPLSNRRVRRHARGPTAVTGV